MFAVSVKRRCASMGKPIKTMKGKRAFAEVKLFDELAKEPS